MNTPRQLAFGLFAQSLAIGVTSAAAFSPGVTRFAYGTYEGTAAVANVPAP
ncbi:hypothetical protein AB4059_14450 [Lysobacter sp. 2RAF19]